MLGITRPISKHTAARIVIKHIHKWRAFREAGQSRFAVHQELSCLKTPDLKAELADTRIVLSAGALWEADQSRAMF